MELVEYAPPVAANGCPDAKADDDDDGDTMCVVPKGVAVLGSQPDLLRVMRGVCAGRETVSDRLFVTLGTGTHSHVTQRFADVVLGALLSADHWEHECGRCPVQRVDYMFRTGTTTKTLFFPRPPFLHTTSTHTKRTTLARVPLRRTMRQFPSHVCLQLHHETPTPLPTACAQQLLHRVCVRTVTAFQTGAWVYRITQVWEGGTRELALQAQACVPPRVEVTLELKLRQFPRVADAKETLMALLFRVEGLVNVSLDAHERATFGAAQTGCTV